MKNLVRRAIPLALALSVMASVGLAQRSNDHHLVPLEKIIANPKSFRHLVVSFVVQFHQLGTIDNPVYTKFEEDWFQNFSVWPDSSLLWVREQYAKDFPYMFIRRLSQGAQTLGSAPIYSRWVMTGSVESDYRGHAWIEIVGLTPVPESLDPTALGHIVRGFQSQGRNSFDEAAAAFHAAEHKGLPMNVRSLAMRQEALCLHRAGRTELGIARMLHACRALPEDAANEATLTSLRAAAGLDPDGHAIPVMVPAGPGGGAGTVSPALGTPLPPGVTVSPVIEAPVGTSEQPLIIDHPIMNKPGEKPDVVRPIGAPNGEKPTPQPDIPGTPKPKVVTPPGSGN